MDMKEYIKHRIEVMQAHLDGKTVQFRFIDGADSYWRGIEPNDDPSFNFYVSEYRIKPAEPDYINWEHIGSKYSFMARDENGSLYFYQSRPLISDRSWQPVDGEDCALIPDGVLSSYRSNGYDWTQSLSARRGFGE